MSTHFQKGAKIDRNRYFYPCIQMTKGYVKNVHNDIWKSQCCECMSCSLLDLNVGIWKSQHFWNMSEMSTNNWHLLPVLRSPSTVRLVVIASGSSAPSEKNALFFGSMYLVDSVDVCRFLGLPSGTGTEWRRRRRRRRRANKCHAPQPPASNRAQGSNISFRGNPSLWYIYIYIYIYTYMLLHKWTP